MTARPVGLGIAVLSLLAIGAATLVPGTEFADGPRWSCIVCGDRGVADAIVNAVLFAPLGVGLALAMLDPRLAVVGGTLVSGLVEFAQITVVPGRDASIGDVLFNTLGTGAGFGMVWLFPILGRLTDRHAARLSCAAAGAASLTVALTGWLLQPSFPRTNYWGQWTPDHGHLASYRGHVRSARVGGMDVGSQRIARSDALRSALLAGTPIEVQFIAGPAVPRLASLFSVFDQDRIEVVLLGPDRTDLVYRYRTRAAAARLDQPDLRLPDGMRGVVAGDSLTATVTSQEPGSFCLMSSKARQCGLGFTLGWGWALLFYSEAFAPWLRALLAIAWTASLSMPAGLLLRRRWESVVAISILLLTFGVLPGIFHLRPTRGIEWLAAGIGLVAAGAAAPSVMRLRARWTCGSP